MASDPITSACPECGGSGTWPHRRDEPGRQFHKRGCSQAEPGNAARQVEGDFTIGQPCGAPAPAVVNGALFVGCQLAAGHDGQHKVEIAWGPAPAPTASPSTAEEAPH